MTLEPQPNGFSSVQEQSYIHSNREAIARVFQNQNLLQKIICLDRVHAERLPKIHFLLPSLERRFQCSQEAFVFNNMAGKMPRTIYIWLCVHLVVLQKNHNYYLDVRLLDSFSSKSHPFRFYLYLEFGNCPKGDFLVHFPYLIWTEKFAYFLHISLNFKVACFTEHILLIYDKS